MTSLASKSGDSHASSAFQDLYNSVTDMSGINSLKQSFQDLKKSNTAAASAVLVGSPSNGSSASTAHSSKANAIINRVAKDVNRSIAKRSLSKAPLSSRDISKAFEPFDVNRDGLVTRGFHQGLQSVTKYHRRRHKKHSRKRDGYPWRWRLDTIFECFEAFDEAWKRTTTGDGEIKWKTFCSNVDGCICVFGRG